VFISELNKRFVCAVNTLRSGINTLNEKVHHCVRRAPVRHLQLGRAAEEVQGVDSGPTSQDRETGADQGRVARVACKENER